MSGLLGEHVQGGEHAGSFTFLWHGWHRGWLVLLNLLENVGIDDRFMVALDVVPGNLAGVLAYLFGQEVGGVAVLQQQVTFIFLVGQERADRAGRPGSLTLHGF